MDPNCLFCKISNKKTETKLIYDDDEIAAFDDIKKDFKVHILIVPKKHITSVAELEESDEILVGKMVMVAKKLAEEKGIAKTGYRLIFNVGKGGGQVIEHIHLHLIGGSPLGSTIL